jgi:hypothetical protein
MEIVPNYPTTTTSTDGKLSLEAMGRLEGGLLSGGLGASRVARPRRRREAENKKAKKA